MSLRCLLFNCYEFELLWSVYNLEKINVKTSQFKTQCKGDISHAFETAKITVFDPTVCKTPDAPLQNELLYWTFVVRGDNWRE